MNVVVDGLMTSYLKSGKGKVLVFLHGWADSSKSFNDLAGYLAADYTILALDLPGFGASQTPEKAWGLENYADFVAKWLDKIGIKDVYAFVGHSNGGAVAIKGLASGQLKSHKLVLLASAGVRDRQKARKVLLKAMAKTGKLLTAPLPRITRRKLRQKFYGTVGSELTLLPHMEETFRRVVGEDIQSQAATLKLPTLLIYGNLDEATPTKYGELLNQAIDGSKIEFLTGVGHFLHQEQPDEIAKRMLGFLRGKS
jgi:pimeloyl-ACP methyl ester carboxylesterase